MGAPLHPLARRGRPTIRHAVGDRWHVDKAYLTIGGRWRYVYRAIDQFGQVIDVFVSQRNDAKAARRFFERAIGATKRTPVEVVTDKAPVYPLVLEELLPAAWHRTDRYANNHIEADHGHLKSRLVRCGGSNRTAAPGWPSPGTPSCRTSAEDITSLPSTAR